MSSHAELNQELVAEKAKILIEELNNKALERDELVRAIVLCFLSSKHFFLIGKPGVGKTFIANKLKYVMDDGIFFKYLLANDTKPDEIFGFNHTNENGEVVHNTEKSIINANIVILDEMFKAKSELLNGMLGALSPERNFFLKGVGEIQLDLISAFATSNEFPADETLDPFDDRLHFRYEVLRLKEDENFKKMITKDYDTSNNFSVGFSFQEIQKIKSEYSKIKFDDNVLQFFIKLKNEIVKNGLNISDRKLDEAVDVFRASAYLNKREFIDHSDLFILMHMGWRDFTERKKLKQIIFDVFFQKKEYIEKIKIDIKERLSYMLSFASSNTDTFLMNKIKFDFEKEKDIIAYNNYIDSYLSVLNAFEELRHSLVFIEDSYKFAMMVEQKIEQNIFIIDYKNTSFVKEFIDSYNIINKNFNDKYSYYLKFIYNFDNIYKVKNNCYCFKNKTGEENHDDIFQKNFLLRIKSLEEDRSQTTNNTWIENSNIEQITGETA